ncbi:MAG: histidine kinase, partial [Bacteroidota bacterium]
VHSIAIDSKKQLWFLSKGKLHKLEGREKIIAANTLYPEMDSFPELRQLSQVSFGQNDHMFLTHQNGVVVFTEKGFQDLRAKKDLSGNKSFSLTYLPEDSSIWITGFGGLDKFVFDEEKESYVKTLSKGKQDGLPVELYGEVISFNDKIYLNSSSGIYIFEPDEAEKYRLPPIPINITHFQSEDSSFKLNEEIKLTYQQNNLRIKLDGISFQNGEKVTYAYRLNGNTDIWNRTEINEISYTNLKPGSYTFEVYAERENTELNAEDANIVKLEFDIIPHFTQTWFFIIFMFTLCALLLAYAVYRFLRWKDRLDRRQRIITELKYQALQSQMSPHFIFNSMNSISYLVKNNKSEEADRYLNQFAGLLRGVLENAQFSFVSLMEEMELVQNYLELEQLQFGKQFQYFIDMDPELMAYGLQIPPMLIQPIIENSIRHGISPKGYGNVRVEFRDQQRYLQVSVEDDGVGRKFAAEMKKQSLRRSSKTQVGLKNIHERISVLNHLYELDMKMEVMDLEEGSKASGTRVVFRFPKVKHLAEIEKSPFHSYQDLAENQDQED